MTSSSNINSFESYYPMGFKYIQNFMLSKPFSIGSSTLLSFPLNKLSGTTTYE